MNIILLTGSNRRDATSTLLAKAIAGRIEASGHTAVLFDLFEKPLPIFDPDEDYDGQPNVGLLLGSFMVAHAVVLASPEYHGTVSGVLKNALDFLAFEHFDGKAVLSAASSGGGVAFGTLTHLQWIVRNLHGINCPEWISIGGAERVFKPDGTPAELKVQSRINKTTDYFLQMAKKLH
jgi:azobenzene reductase